MGDPRVHAALNCMARGCPRLIGFVNKYCEEKIPEGWKVEFIPYDWRLNSQ
jgi:hypothetical protein